MSRSLPVAPRGLRYAGVVGCSAVILAASLVDPGDGDPALLFSVETTVYLHFVAYAGLAASAGYARLSTDVRSLLVAVAFAALFGAFVEVMQGLVPYRTASGFDAIVNAFGATAGAGAWRATGRWFGARNRPDAG